MVTKWSQKDTKDPILGTMTTSILAAIYCTLATLAPPAHGPRMVTKPTSKKEARLTPNLKNMSRNGSLNGVGFPPENRWFFDSDTRTAYRRPRDPKIGPKDSKGLKKWAKKASKRCSKPSQDMQNWFEQHIQVSCLKCRHTTTQKSRNAYRNICRDTDCLPNRE